MKKTLAPICSFYCARGHNAARMAEAVVLLAKAKRSNAREKALMCLMLLGMALATLLSGCARKAHAAAASVAPVNAYAEEHAAPASGRVPAPLK